MFYISSKVFWISSALCFRVVPFLFSYFEVSIESSGIPHDGSLSPLKARTSKYLLWLVLKLWVRLRRPKRNQQNKQWNKKGDKCAATWLLQSCTCPHRNSFAPPSHYRYLLLSVLRNLHRKTRSPFRKI